MMRRMEAMRPVKVRPLLLSVGITAAAGFLGGLLAQLVASFVTIQYDSVFGYVDMKATARQISA